MPSMHAEMPALIRLLESIPGILILALCATMHTQLYDSFWMRTSSHVSAMARSEA